MNQNQQHGARTGQHQQKRQQAELPGCVDACEEMERAKPVMRITADLSTGASEYFTGRVMRGIVRAFFRHHKRIEITRFINLAPWQDAARAALARQLSRRMYDPENSAEEAERAAEMDGDRRSDEDRGR